MKTQFYVINENCSPDDKFARGEGFGPSNTGTAEYCKGCKKTLSFIEWLTSSTIKVSAENNLGDLIFGTYQGFMASKRFIELFQSANLKGLSNIRKVNLYFNDKLLNEEYYYSTIIKINAFIDLNRVDCHLINQKCDVCQVGNNTINSINGIIFLNPEQIDKDIFYSTSVIDTTIIISQKFKDFIDANNFTNIELIKTEDYKRGRFKDHPEWWLTNHDTKTE